VLPITEMVHLIRYHSNSHHVHVPISRFLRPITSKLSLHCNNSLQTKRTYSRFENPTYYATRRADVDGAPLWPKSPLPWARRMVPVAAEMAVGRVGMAVGVSRRE
jgi:hypothetical protein